MSGGRKGLSERRFYEAVFLLVLRDLVSCLDAIVGYGSSVSRSCICVLEATLLEAISHSRAPSHFPIPIPLLASTSPLLHQTHQTHISPPRPLSLATSQDHVHT